MRVYLLDYKHIFEVKDEILKKDYHDCDIVLNDNLYNFITGGNSRLYMEFYQLCKSRNIVIDKKYVQTN